MFNDEFSLRALYLSEMVPRSLLSGWSSLDVSSSRDRFASVETNCLVVDCQVRSHDCDDG